MNLSGSFRRICLQLSKQRIRLSYPQQQKQLLSLRPNEVVLAEHTPMQSQQTSDGLQYVLGKKGNLQSPFFHNKQNSPWASYSSDPSSDTTYSSLGPNNTSDTSHVTEIQHRARGCTWPLDPTAVLRLELIQDPSSLTPKRNPKPYMFLKSFLH